MFWHLNKFHAYSDIIVMGTVITPNKFIYNLWQLFCDCMEIVKKKNYRKGVTSHFPNLHLHTLFSEMFNSELPLTLLDSHQYYLLSDQQF